MIIDTISLDKVWAWVQAVWAKSLFAVMLFCLGLWIGVVNTESSIAADCKFAGAFRVDIQAFVCQRKI